MILLGYMVSKIVIFAEKLKMWTLWHVIKNMAKDVSFIDYVNL